MRRPAALSRRTFASFVLPLVFAAGVHGPGRAAPVGSCEDERELFKTRFLTPVVVNPSYYVFAAIRELAVLEPSPVWREVEAAGLSIISQGRFGTCHLPADRPNHFPSVATSPDYYSAALTLHARATWPGWAGPGQSAYDKPGFFRSNFL